MEIGFINVTLDTLYKKNIYIYIFFKMYFVFNFIAYSIKCYT